MRDRGTENRASLRNTGGEGEKCTDENEPAMHRQTQQIGSKTRRREKLSGRFPGAEPYRPSTCLLLRWKRTRDDRRS